MLRIHHGIFIDSLDFLFLFYLCEGGTYHYHAVCTRLVTSSSFPTLFTVVCQRKKWQLTPVFLPGKSHGWKSLVGYRRARHNTVTEPSPSYKAIMSSAHQHSFLHLSHILQCQRRPREPSLLFN